MTSEQRYAEAYVWAWLPGQTQPVVAGRLAREGSNFRAPNAPYLFLACSLLLPRAAFSNLGHGQHIA